jgi:hypothetical protein
MGSKVFQTWSMDTNIKNSRIPPPIPRGPSEVSQVFEQFIILVGRKVELFNVCHDLSLIAITIRKHLAEGREVRQKLKTHTHTHTKDLSHTSIPDMLLIHTDSYVLQI